MCGIAGFWDYKTTGSNNETILKKMAATIAHRGPDDEGYFFDDKGVALAHKRLSIIDLSSSGHQPMHSKDNRYTIVFNGEIYNYIEIAKTLADTGVVFKGHSDTEVLLEAYKAYGEKCLDLLNGMFAFVIWDKKENTLFAARDRFGIKPFYYFNSLKEFVFGSEIKAVKEHPKVSTQPNSEAIHNYLTLSHQLDHQTWYKDIFLLEPGHYLLISRDKLVKKAYWKPQVCIDYGRSYDSFKEELNFRIEEAIILHQRSDLEVGAHLSGGIDSSAIVAIASKFHQKKMHTFSSSFTGLGVQYDENREIDEVKKTFATIHHQISADPTKIVEILPQLINMLDEPVAGPAIIPMYFVNKLISENNIKVVNGGQGVDELFGGYRPSYTLAAHNLISLLKSGKHVPFEEILRIPSYLNKGGSFSRLFKKSNQVRYNLFHNPSVTSDAIERYQTTQNNYGTDLLRFEQNMLMSLQHYLPALLQQEDRMSMNWSIESRVPFLDHRLVEFSFTVPSYYKVKKGVTKSVFREALRGKVPNLILNNKIKRGYPTPISVWLRKEMSQFFYKTLVVDNSSINEYVNMEQVKMMLNDHVEGKGDYTTPLWSALCTKLWFNQNFK